MSPPAYTGIGERGIQQLVGTTHCQLGKHKGESLGNRVHVSEGRRKKVYPVDVPLRGHSLETTGPWTPLYVYYPRTPFSYENTMLSTPHVLDFPPPSPTRHQGALIVTKDTSAVTNDLPRQGQRRPHQRLRQWNRQTHGEAEDIFMYFLRRYSFHISL